jgi:hypothetical protein
MMVNAGDMEVYFHCPPLQVNHIILWPQLNFSFVEKLTQIDGDGGDVLAYYAYYRYGCVIS